MKRRLLGACLLLASCSHAPAAPEGDQAPAVGPPEVAWADMSKEQRGKYMKAKVLPKMKELMASFAPEHEHEGDVTCATCHVDGAKTKTFKMPDPGLEVLPASEEGWKKLSATKGDWLKFMNQHVKPEIAKLLGKEPFDPENPKEGAFGCGACHTSEAKPQG